MTNVRPLSTIAEVHAQPAIDADRSHSADGRRGLAMPDLEVNKQNVVAFRLRLQRAMY